MIGVNDILPCIGNKEVELSNIDLVTSKINRSLINGTKYISGIPFEFNLYKLDYNGRKLSNAGVRKKSRTREWIWKDKMDEVIHAPKDRRIKSNIHFKHNLFVNNFLKVENIVSLIGPDLEDHVLINNKIFKELKSIHSYEILKKIFSKQLQELPNIKSKSEIRLFNKNIHKSKIKEKIQYADLDYTSYLTDKLILNIINFLKTNDDHIDKRFALSICYMNKDGRGHNGYHSPWKLIKALIYNNYHIESKLITNNYKNKGTTWTMTYATFIIDKLN